MANLMPMPIMGFFDNNGNPLNGGKLYAYLTGTSTATPTYTDAGGLTANTNPVVLNARGEASVWLDPAITYKCILRTSLGAQLWSVDGVTTNASLADVRSLIGGVLTKSVAGGSNVTLTASEAAKGILVFTGALTANISVILPASPTRSWVVRNNTTGAFTLTVKTAAGTGVAVTQTESNSLYSDGTNISQVVTELVDALLSGNVTLGSTTSTAGDFNLKSNTALADAAATLTAAQMIGGEFTITPTAARILTTDTAANIIAAMVGSVDNSNFDIVIGNAAAFDVTLAAGAGVTIVNRATISNGSGHWRMRRTSGSTVSFVRMDGALTGIQLGASVATTSGTSIDFTGIPAGVKIISLIMNGVSTNGSSDFLVQIGSAAIQTTGYTSTGSLTGSSSLTASSASGMLLYNNSAAHLASVKVSFDLFSGTTWVSSHSGKLSTAFSCNGGGDVALSGVLDRLRLTTVGGTAVFDAGTVNISWEF